MKVYFKILDDYKLLLDKHSREKVKKKYLVSKKLKGNITDLPKERSLDQLHYYWMIMKFLEYNTPENILYLLEVEHLTDNAWNEICKCRFSISSVALENLESDKMNNYINQLQIWIATFILHCKVEDVETEIKNFYDDLKRR